MCIFLAIWFKNVFFNILNLVVFRTKVARGDVIKLVISQFFTRIGFFYQTTYNWCPERYAKFHVDSDTVHELFGKNRGGVMSPSAGGQGLTLNRLGGLITPFPRFFRNNSWTLADIDMKLGMTLRISVLRRLVSKNPIRANVVWDIADFVTSPPAILVW